MFSKLMFLKQSVIPYDVSFYTNIPSYTHKKARNISYRLFCYYHRVYLVSLVTYLVELAGVEPASEIPTSSVLHA